MWCIKAQSTIAGAPQQIYNLLDVALNAPLPVIPLRGSYV